MKQSLYKVPEGFFENVESATLERVGKTRKRRLALLCAMPLVLAVAFFGFSRYNHLPQDYSSLDDCDVFLEVFEY